MHPRAPTLLCFLCCASLLAGCGAQGPPPDVAADVRRSGGVCSDLAHAFFLIARKRDRQVPRAAQVQAAQERVQNSFVADPETTLRDLLHVIDVVYANPELAAPELEATVLDHCEVDARGRAVLTATPSAL